MLKIEIGGGTRPRNPADGFQNLDQFEGADIRHDLNLLPWPIEDASVDEIYTSHCVEHVHSSIDFCREIARICKIGAHVEIRAPDPLSEGMMVDGHLNAFGVQRVRHMDSVFPKIFWHDLPRRLKHERTVFGADDLYFPMARESHLFKDWTDEEILIWVPRTRHENHFHFTVIENPDP